MGTTTNPQYKIVLAHGLKPLAYVAILNGQKTFFWDQSFMPAAPHGNIEFFCEELYQAIGELMELPAGWLKFVRYEKMIESMIFALDHWPEIDDLLEIENRIIHEETKDYVTFIGAEVL